MKNLIYLTTFIFSVVFLTSCSKDDSIGSGTATLQITAGFKNSTTDKQSASKMTSQLNFTSGFLRVVEIVFDGTLDTGVSVSRTLEGSSKIYFTPESGFNPNDLDPEENSEFVIDIPVAIYTDVNLGIELRDEDSLSSIEMKGTYTRNDDTTVAILFEFNSGEVFEAETTSEQESVDLREDNVLLSRIVFDPNEWFKDVLLAGLLENVTPVNIPNDDNVNVLTIVISETSNAAIFDLVADGLDVSTQATFSIN